MDTVNELVTWIEGKVSEMPTLYSRHGGPWAGGRCLRQQWTRLPRGLTLSHTLECRLIIHTYLETLTHTLSRNTNYAWNDVGDLDGTPKVTDTLRRLKPPSHFHGFDAGSATVLNRGASVANRNTSVTGP